ncbi:MAG: nucleoside recognition protein [Verrucomicrobiales bacterium]|nr:nucleoside recognition protein [Verrucomicrobiales bacterium]
MLNWIWFGMMVFSVLAALLLGRLGATTKGALDAAEIAVMKVMLPQAGFIAVWMGIMRLVEKSGMIHLISRLLGPVLRFLFPGVPQGHPALGAIALNLGASMLGAGNAATPAGLRAMAHLQTLNPHKHVATNEMCMLLALSTAVITLIPASTITLLHSMGSKRSTEVILPAFLTTAVAAVIAMAACKLLQRYTVFQPGAGDEAAAKAAEEIASRENMEETAPVGAPLAFWKKSVLALFLLLPAAVCLLHVFHPGLLHDWQAGLLNSVKPGMAPDASTLPAAASGSFLAGFQRFGTFLAAAAIPLFMGYFVLHAAFSKVKVFEEFVDGAKEGVNVSLRVIPYVAGLLVAIRMMQESGLLELVRKIIGPVLEWLHFPMEVLPMALIRPLSGGAARGVLADIAQRLGPDHPETMIAATINGSTETTFYVAAVYFGAVGIKRMRHAIAAGLIADVAIMFLAVAICALLF